MYPVPAPGDDEPEGEVGEAGWNVGLWDGVCKGFFGSSETGGELITSDYLISQLP
jgi:hypothetical protein